MPNEAYAKYHRFHKVLVGESGADELMQIHNAGPLDSAVSLFHSALLRLQDSAANPGGRTLDRENEQKDGDDDRRGLIVLE